MRNFFLFLVLSLFAISNTFAIVVIRTTPIKYIGMDSAISGGQIISTGGEQIIEAGICWSKTPQPTTGSSIQVRSTSTDSFQCNLRNLSPGQAYYVRAYAVTASGTWYGPQRTLATDKLIFGNMMKGGRLFYVLQAGDPGFVIGEFHGLVLHVISSNTTITWRNSKDTLIGAVDTSMFTGQLNTAKIVNTLGEGTYAAKVCYDLVYQGYSDWYLPSQNELALALQRLNKYILGYSWSSSEFNKSSAIQCTGLRKRNSIKTQKGSVFAIRKF